MPRHNGYQLLKFLSFKVRNYKLFQNSIAALNFSNTSMQSTVGVTAGVFLLISIGFIVVSILALHGLRKVIFLLMFCPVCIRHFLVNECRIFFVEFYYQVKLNVLFCFMACEKGLVSLNPLSHEFTSNFFSAPA